MITVALAAVITTPPTDDGGWLDWLDPTEWVEKAGTGILTQIAEGLGEAAASFLTGIWGAIAESTTPQVDAPFLREWYGRVFAISLPITVGFVALQVILTMIRSRGAAGLGRAVWGGGVAVLGTFAAVPVVALLIAAVDGLAMDLAEISSGGIETMLTQVTSLLLGGDPANGAHVVGGTLVGTVGAIMLGFLAVVGAIAVWMALLIRSMLLYVVVVIAPICFAGLVWEPTRAWFRRWLTMIVALVFTKLGVVLVFGIGVAAVGSAGQGTSSWQQLGQLFSGLVMLAMASLVPIACFKFFSFLGDESVQALHSGAAGGAARGTEAARTMASKPMDALRRQSSGSGNGSASGRPPSEGKQGGGSSPSSAGRPATGAPSGAGGATPGGSAGAGGASAGGGAGVGAAGGVAAGAGALVGAGVAAGAKAAQAGRSGAAHADAHHDQVSSGDGGGATASRTGSSRGSSGGTTGSSQRRQPGGAQAAPGSGGGGSASPRSASGSRPRPASGGTAGGAKAPPIGKP